MTRSTRAAACARRAGLATLLAASVFGCEPVGPPPFDAPLTLDGVAVDAATLNRGRDVYNAVCRSCHGPHGDGLGPLGVHQKPPARDLRLGILKYAAVPSGELPRDEDLERVVRRGLPGTAMLPWDVPERDLAPVLAYVRAFSPRWREGGRAGTAIVVGADPWASRAAEAIARGEALFHEQAQCATCHRSPGRAAASPAPSTDPPRLVTDSVYGPLSAPDLTTARLRNGETPEDLVRVIAAGVGGTAMPSWKGGLPDEDLWALAHYLRSRRAASAQ